MAIKTFKGYFMGTFQCRLATDPAPTNGTVAAPPAPGDFSLGWTFDFGEAPLDRVIRLSKPLALRKDGLMFPWQDTTLYGAEADRGKGLVGIEASDPVRNSVVSLGSNVKFDAAAGGGAGHEALVGFELGLGDLLKAKGNPDPRCNATWNHSLQPGWDNLYKTVKPQRANGIPPGIRHDHAALQFTQTMYANFYSALGKIDEAPLKTPTITATTGVLAELKKQMTAAKPGAWTVTVFFMQFDGDTLVGMIFGIVSAAF